MDHMKLGYMIGNVTFGCISFVASSFVIYAYAAWKQGRKSPGDIIFALGVSSMFIAIYLIVMPIYAYLNTQDGQVDADSKKEITKVCYAFGMISSLGYYGQFVYNFAYCTVLRQAITNVIKVNKRFKIISHAVCLFFILVPVGLLYTSIEPKVNGMCSNNIDSNYIFLEIMSQFGYIIQALYTIWYFYANIPNDESLKGEKRTLLIRYVIYIALTILIIVLTVLSNVSQSLAQTDSRTVDDYQLVTSLACSCIPMMLCFVLYKNPKIKKKLIKKKNDKKNESSLLGKQEQLERSIEGGEKKQDLKIDGQFRELQKNIRMFQIKKILNGILYYHSQRQRLNLDSLKINSDKGFLDEDDIANTMFKLGLDEAALNEEYSFHIHVKKGESIPPQLAIKDLALYPKMSALAPRAFDILMELDHVRVRDSFDPEKNAANIESMVGPDGGASGEFFFFTFDNQWILKTIIPPELEAFRKRLPQYVHHLAEFRNSLINKMYGVYSIDMNQSQAQFTQEGTVYHMVLMRNLSRIPRPYITRIFDLKGSEFARQVLKGNHERIALDKITLKDKDFETTEKKVNIDLIIMNEVKTQLKLDAKFFQCCQLMDYSLLIMKVDWGSYLTDHPELSLDTIREQFNKYQFIKENTTSGIYYHFSVIDYFQEWNLKKVTEKAAKQLIAFNANLDTSAQNPDFYAERFVNNVVEKLFI